MPPNIATASSPSLEDRMACFHVSPTHAFLVEHPAVRLPEQYNAWHDMCDDLQSLIESDPTSMRPLLDGMEEIELPDDLSYEQQRLVHGLMCTMVAAYLWADRSGKPPSSIPRSLSLPYYKVSQLLGMYPVVSHHSTCLANWRRISADADTSTVKADDLDLIYFKLIRDDTNVWFFTLTAELEFLMAPAIRACASICHSADTSPVLVTEVDIDVALEDIIESLGKCTALFERFKERMTPAAFYHELRPYLWGYANVEGGVTFEGLEHLGPLKYAGASAAQSCILQTLDAFLGVKHSGHNDEFMRDQRGYMPRGNREFIEWIEKIANSDVISNRIKSRARFTDVINALHTFRSFHLKAVALFILTQTKDSQESGTGGSSLMTFLKTVREEGNNTLIQ